MKENITVSIIIPVYNTEKYLRQCLDSVLNQTFKDFECICINDCSTDNSYSVLEEYAKKDDRFVLINLAENKGQGNARNQGIKIAKGKYITFVDSDDWVKENHIENLYNSIIKYESNIVIDSFDNIGRYVSSCFCNKIITTCEDKKILILYEPIISINFIVEKNFIDDKEILFPNSKTNEDFLFLFKIFANESKIVYINNKSYFYRTDNPSSTTKSVGISKKTDYMELFKFFADIINIFKQAQTFDIYTKEIYCYLLLLFCKELPVKNLSKQEYLNAEKYFKDNFYKDNFNFLRTKKIRNKIRLIIFCFCLKFNINYTKIGQILKYINNIFYCERV